MSRNEADFSAVCHTDATFLDPQNSAQTLCPLVTDVNFRFLLLPCLGQSYPSEKQE